MSSLCTVQLKAMHHQDIERSPTGRQSVTSDSSNYTEVCHEADEELVIDFDNVEDILDFSVRPLSEIMNAKKQRPKQRRKMIAAEPVTLLELKPKIDKFVNDRGCNPEQCEEGHETKQRRFQCIYCGSKFVRSTHLQRHIRIHTGDKPYVCPICMKPFSRSDYKSAHILRYHKEQVHYCCGKAFDNLTKFAEHCRSHDYSAYMRIVTSKELELLKAQDPILVTTFKEELEEISCVTIEKIDNSITEECIVRVENPIYMLHRPIITVNVNVN